MTSSRCLISTRSFVLAAMLAVALTATIGASLAAAAWPGREGPVLYRDLDFGAEAEGLEAAGLSAFRLEPRASTALSTRGEDADPQASPDGRLIVFSRGIDPALGGYPTAAAIFLMRAGGGGVRQLTTPPAETHDLEPTFDASGRRVIFVRLGNEARPGTNQGDIVSVDLAGDDLRTLTSGPAADRAPAASPDRRQVVFTRARAPLPNGQISSLTHLLSIRQNGSQLRDLTPRLAPSAPVSDPDFSPSGRVIAVAIGQRSAAEIYTLRRSGKRLRQLTGRGRPASSRGYGYAEPSFSPAGGRLIATAINRYNANPALIELRSPDHPQRLNLEGDQPYWGVAIGR